MYFSIYGMRAPAAPSLRASAMVVAQVAKNRKRFMYGSQMLGTMPTALAYSCNGPSLNSTSMFPSLCSVKLDLLWAGERFCSLMEAGFCNTCVSCVNDPIVS